MAFFGIQNLYGRDSASDRAGKAYDAPRLPSRVWRGYASPFPTLSSPSPKASRGGEWRGVDVSPVLSTKKRTPEVAPAKPNFRMRPWQNALHSVLFLQSFDTAVNGWMTGTPLVSMCSLPGQVQVENRASSEKCR